MDRGAWWATVHGVAKSRTRLSDFTFIQLPFDHRVTLVLMTPDVLKRIPDLWLSVWDKNGVGLGVILIIRWDGIR